MEKNASFVFFGTPEFAATVFREVTDAGFPPALLVANPDRPVGRKQIITPPPAKIAAQKYGVPVFQPESSKDIQGELQGKGYDFFVVAAYAKILPQEILALPRLGVIGVHPSLLPKYRGPSPIQSAILGGEKETGTTLFLLDEKVDHGPILARAACSIEENDNYETLLRKLATASGELLGATLPKFLARQITPQPQNEAEATSTKKFTAEDSYISEEDLREAEGGDLEKAKIIWRKTRALNPEPGVWTVKNGKRIKMLAASLRGGMFRLEKIQIEGQKPRVV